MRELALGNGLHPGQGTYKGSEFILSPFPTEILMVKNQWRIALGSPIVSELASLLLVGPNPPSLLDLVEVGGAFLGHCCPRRWSLS